MISPHARLVDALSRLEADEPIHDALRDSALGPNAGQPIADAIRCCKRAHRSLDLYGIRLGKDSAVPILDMLREWPGCTSLDLGANGLGTKAAAHLAPLLLLTPPLDPDDDFLLPGEDKPPPVSNTSHTPIRELRLARNGPSFDGSACAALLEPRAAPDGALALATLGLSFNPLGTSGGVAIGAAMRAGRLPRLQHIQLQGCAMSAEAATALARGLPNARSLMHLDLSDNSIGDDGACAIASELHMSPSLHELLLSRNQLGEKAAYGLATALVRRGRAAGKGSGCRLTMLSLSHNQIRTQGACALAEALGADKGNRTLTSLYLRANKLAQPALLALGDALIANAKLTFVDLGLNKRLSADDLAALEGLLKQNRAAARGLPPPEKVVLSENAVALVDARVQRMIHQPSEMAAPFASRPAARTDEDRVSRDAHQCAEVATALHTVQEDLERAAREVARLRQREVALETALRNEGFKGRLFRDEAVDGPLRPFVTLT